MGIRVNPDLYQTLVQGIGQLQQNENNDLEQMSSGKRINNLSDDPAAVAQLILNEGQTSDVDQYLANVTTVQNSMQVADSALNSVTTALSQAISLGIEGANGTMNASNEQAIATQVSGIQQQILALANTTYDGNYLFAGTAVTTQPFTEDSSSPSGVTYNGNGSTNSVQIGDGEYVPTNLSGSQVFTPSGSDVFAALQGLVTALQSGGDVASATSQLQQVFSRVNTQSTFYGATLSRLQNTQNYLTQEQLGLSSAQDNIESADMATVISNYTQTETALDASYQAAGQLSQMSLLDYLK
ncbi:MAG: flagellar hook-associated protein FlgL [Terriglobia bacterium]